MEDSKYIEISDLIEDKNELKELQNSTVSLCLIYVVIFIIIALRGVMTMKSYLP